MRYAQPFAAVLRDTRIAVIVGVALPGVMAALPARAQFAGGLPAVGAGATTPNLHEQLQSYFNPGTPLAARPAFLITPAIEADVGVTDNALRVPAPRRGDFFTIISPQLIASADSAHITANLAYTPQFTIYANESSQTQVYQTFAGQALITFVPDTLFLDLRGSTSESSLTGGFGQDQTQAYNAQNTVQTTSFGISPYATERFGGWGTGTVRYSFDRTLQSTPNGQPVTNTNLALGTYGQPGYGSLGNLSTSTETATFVTGENLGRVNVSTTIDNVNYSGGSSNAGAYRHEAQSEVAFAINHKFSLLAGFGYQDINYGGNPGYHFSGPSYNVGFAYAPTPDTKLTVEYGRQDGSTQVSFDGQFSPTARTRILARYTTSVTTDLQQAQNYLNNTTVGANGVVTDTATGAPVLNSNYNGLQNGVYRLNSFSATALLLQDRNTYSISVGNQKRTTLTSTPTFLNNGLIPTGTATNTTYASIVWQHDLSPDMSLTSSAQYSVTTNAGQLLGTGNQNQSSFSFSAVLTKQFSETLSGSLRYSYTNQSGGAFVTNSGTNVLNNGSYSENIILVGLRKSF